VVSIHFIPIQQQKTAAYLIRRHLRLNVKNTASP